MPQFKVNLANLGRLTGGTADATVNCALQAAATDVDDRGSDGKERKVNITVFMLKRLDGQIEVRVGAEPKVPCYMTASTVCKSVAGKGGKVELLFRDDAPHDPDQKTFNDYHDQSEIPNE